MLTRYRCCVILELLLLAAFVANTEALVTGELLPSAWSFYNSCLRTNPILTKSCTSSMIGTASDIMCQNLVARMDGKAAAKLDMTRVRDVALTGIMWSGPAAHYWYATLELIVKNLLPVAFHSGPKGLVARIFFDAMIFSPVTVFGYFTVRTLLERDDAFVGTRIRAKLSASWSKAVQAAWKFWPIVNIGTSERSQPLSTFADVRHSQFHFCSDPISRVVCQCAESVLDWLLDFCKCSAASGDQGG